MTSKWLKWDSAYKMFNITTFLQQLSESVSRSVVSDSMTPWTVARQAPLSMEISRQYWSGLPCPSPGDLPEPGIEPRSPALQADSLPSELLGKVLWSLWDVAKLPNSYWGSNSVFLTSEHRMLKSFADNLPYLLLYLFPYTYDTSYILSRQENIILGFF